MTKPSTLIKNKKMVQLIMTKGMDQGRAYAASRNKPYTGQVDHVKGYQMMSKPESQLMLQQMRDQFLQKAPEAFKKIWQMIDDETVPPQTKAKLLTDNLDRAGLGNIDMSLHKHEHTHKYPEFVKSKEEIIAMMDEPETAEEITKRNNR